MTDAIEQIVRALPGVVALYSTAPAIVQSAKQLLPGESSLVEVTGSGDSLRVTVSVGVDAGIQAPVTAATIAAAIRESSPELAGAEITVRVSRVTRS